ncbi:MAG: MFS transporter [Pseudomonadota bacterium]|nr:MFS transporter [Pseudomonadota bacterium]
MPSAHSRFAANYFFFFLFAGIHVAYWPKILAQHGYSDYHIGVIGAVFVLLRVIAPGFWGHLADTHQNHKTLLLIKAFASLLSMALIFISIDHYVALLASTALFGFFLHGLLPLYETTTLNYLDGDNHRYNLIRLWGSISFIIAVFATGALLDILPESLIYGLLLGSLALLFISTYRMPNLQAELPAAKLGATAENFLRSLGRPAVVVFFLTAFLMHMSHGQFYGFFTLSLEEAGYSSTHIGALWAIGVVVEIIVFMTFKHLRCYLSDTTIWLSCLAFAVVRWLIMAYCIESWPMVWFAQLFHAFTFGGFHSLMMIFIHGQFAKRQQARAQSFNTAFCYGLGTGLGIFLAGVLMEQQGSMASYLIASAQAFAALIIAIFGALWMKRQPNKE